MNWPVTLVGSPATWRFRDSGVLDDWLDGAPWIDRPDVRLVRTSSGAAADALRSLRRAIVAADDQRSGVRVEVGDGEPAADSPVRAIAALLELPPGVDWAASLHQTADRLAGKPTVFLLSRSAWGVAALPETTHWVDHLGKLGARVTVLLLDTPAAPLGPRAFDLSVGLPADGLFGDADPGEAERWRAYAHRRLAWEAAGDPDRARAWDRRALAVPQACDDRLENTLNELAAEAWAGLSPGLRQAVSEQLRHLLHRSRLRGWVERSAGELDTAGVYWRPPGSDRPRPSAWAARGLLLSGCVPEASFLLRGCVVCAPLAREVLGRCLDLEADYRAVAWAKRGGASAPPAVRERFERQRQTQSFIARHYPAACPALPDDPWAVADFAEWLHALGRDDPLFKPLDRLRKLRNFLAHGHYIGWEAVRCLAMIERQLYR